jgi:peptide/nickel transport system substrate-binding protein
VKPGLRATAVVVFLGTLAGALAACGGPRESDFPMTLGPSPTAPPPVTATPLPPPPKTLIVCLAEEPSSLYLYGDGGPSASRVLEAIYDGPIDLLNYVHQPVILEALPNLGQDGASIQPVTAVSGDIYLNPSTGLPENLKPGKPYVPAGCEQTSCLRTFQGGEVEMDQMQAVFRLLPGILWSDGEPVKASDSVFSYKLDGEGATPSFKYLFDRTASYVALDDLSVEWTGIPGFLDPEYQGNFWSPLPEHALGQLSAEAMLLDPSANRSPLGWGPYRLVEWTQGRDIELERNPRYFRGDEGLPAFDRLLFRFVGEGPTSAVQQVLTGECDILDDSLLLDSAGQGWPAPSLLATLESQEQQGDLAMTVGPSSLVTRLDFNLAPIDRTSRPAAFDRRVRLAVADCLDLQRFNLEVYGGLGGIPVDGLPPGHPLARPEAEAGTRGAEQAAEALTAAGWIDSDGDPSTPRSWGGGLGIPPGTPLSFALTAPSGEAGEAIARALGPQLAECGIGLELASAATGEMLAPWPDGPVFGRLFETVVWSWPTLLRPVCEAYASWEIPGAAQPLGINAGAFQLPAYDEACRRVQLSWPGGPAEMAAAGEVLGQWAVERPGVPLGSPPRLAVHAPQVCGLAPDATARSLLWNLEELGEGEACLAP